MGDDRGNVYREGDRTIYRASGLGGCVRALVAERMGYEPLPYPEWIQQRFGEGNLHEGDILRRAQATVGVEWAENGHPDDQPEIELEIPPWDSEGLDHLIVRGHCDGVGYVQGLPYIIEAKALSAGEFIRWLKEGFEGFKRYAWQLSCYMIGVSPNEPYQGLFVVKDRNSGDIDFTWVKEPPYSFAEITARVHESERMAAEQWLPTCDISMYPCPFSFLHEDEDDGLPNLSNNEPMRELAMAYLEASREENEAKDRRKSLWTKIRENIPEGEKKIKLPGVNVGYSLRQGAEYFDKEKFVADYPDVDPDQYMKRRPGFEVPSVRLTGPKVNTGTGTDTDAETETEGVTSADQAEGE